MSTLNEIPHWLDFQGIAASIKMSCVRTSGVLLTGSRLRTAAFIARTVPKSSNAQYEELMNEMLSMSEDDLHSLGRELRRGHLITAIGILDFCLFEVLVFMVGTRQEVRAGLPKDLPKQKPGENFLIFAERALKRTGIDRRIGLVNELLKISVASTLLEDLGPLLDKRHAIVHQSKFFAAVPYGEATIMQAQPFPEVSHDEAMLAMITITEIADTVLTEVAKRFFGAELGDLRPLNPALEKVHKIFRQEIEEKRARGPFIELVEDPGWNLFVHEKLAAVVDRTLTVSIGPTTIESLPVSVSCIKHNVHGEKFYVTVDEGDREEGNILMKPSFLTRLLNGGRLLVEYQNVASDLPQFMLLPLDGFKDVWNKALLARTMLGGESGKLL